jgi:hypothetical protein
MVMDVDGPPVRHHTSLRLGRRHALLIVLQVTSLPFFFRRLRRRRAALSRLRKAALALAAPAALY